MTAAAKPVSVLLVQHDLVLGRHLQQELTGHGYATSWCRTGSAALLELRESAPGVVLLDLGIPDTDAVALARTVRLEQPQLLMIVLTAPDSDPELVVARDVGADAYLVTPFTITVLLDRLRSLPGARTTGGADHGDLRLGALRLEIGSRRCWLSGSEVELRPKEFELLAALSTRAGREVNRQDLLNEVWPGHRGASSKTLDVTMAALRHKLAAASRQADAPTITTLRGYGYRLEPP